MPESAYQKKWLLPAVKLSIVLVVAWAVGGTLLKAWDELGKYDWSFSPLWLVAAGGLYLLGLLPAGLFWYHVLQRLGQDARLGETLRAYYVGHLGKYVPGKAMVVIIRAGMLRGRRVNTSLAAASVFFETLTMMSVGAFLAAAILAVWCRGHWLLLTVALGLMVAAGLPTIPPVFRFLARAARVGKSDPAVGEKLASLGGRTLLAGWSAMTVSWALLAMSLWATLEAIGVQGMDLVAHFPQYVAAVSLAMVAGFLSLIPGGLGVRDMILAELMVPYFDRVTCPIDSAATAVLGAVLLRLTWLLAELILSGILYAWHIRGDTQR